jgi:hypothetical protein
MNLDRLRERADNVTLPARGLDAFCISPEVDRILVNLATKHKEIRTIPGG